MDDIDIEDMALDEDEAPAPKPTVPLGAFAAPTSFYPHNSALQPQSAPTGTVPAPTSIGSEVLQRLLQARAAAAIPPSPVPAAIAIPAPPNAVPSTTSITAAAATTPLPALFVQKMAAGNAAISKPTAEVAARPSFFSTGTSEPPPKRAKITPSPAKRATPSSQRPIHSFYEVTDPEHSHRASRSPSPEQNALVSPEESGLTPVKPKSNIAHTPTPLRTPAILASTHPKPADAKKEKEHSPEQYPRRIPGPAGELSAAADAGVATAAAPAGSLLKNKRQLRVEFGSTQALELVGNSPIILRRSPAADAHLRLLKKAMSPLVGGVGAGGPHNAADGVGGIDIAQLLPPHSPMQELANVFLRSGPWLSALASLDLPPFSEPSAASGLFDHAIDTIYGMSPAALRRIRIPKLLVMIKSIAPSDGDTIAAVRDPTGDIDALVHRDVLAAWPQAVGEGAVLLVRNCGVFHPAPAYASVYYLILTAANVVMCWGPNTDPPDMLPNDGILEESAVFAMYTGRITAQARHTQQRRCNAAGDDAMKTPLAAAIGDGNSTAATARTNRMEAALEAMANVSPSVPSGRTGPSPFIWPPPSQLARVTASAPVAQQPPPSIFAAPPVRPSAANAEAELQALALMDPSAFDDVFGE